MSEKNTRTKVVTIKDTKIESLKIKGLMSKSIVELVSKSDYSCF